MLIIGGSFEVEPDQREVFLAGRLDSMRASRNEKGCLEYCMSADPIEPSRVVLVERWADQASLDAHLAGRRDAPPPPEGSVAAKSMSVKIYDVATERPFGS